ncbi:B12-binding domain-containing protein [Sphingomonas sp. SUN039]|uniref:cobalamin B12-binding domain-containing protein n=1 Tax=Sphingomonas sp. SUN039 TaxID=2937787 RepID=UPI00216420A8|nr:cobalamin B12-binding domain-containing protein [Sphingomonas sp. SUN039]UVO54109.1 cobalamin B12-binding domain-containing protein [Sphingomonas sp. SUN039]
MASVVGMMEQARAFLPDFVARRKRGAGPRGPEPREPQSPVSALKIVGASPLPNFANPLADLIERAVIPRVVEAHLADTIPVDVRNRWHDEALSFAAMAIDADAKELLDRLDTMLDSGTEIEAILVHILAPAARRLGIMWEQDDCDFVDVTMGLWRLQEVVRELSSRIPARPGLPTGGYRAVFSAMPGEQHNFGTVIVEDIFRRAGWSTELLLEAQQGALLAAVASDRYDLVGLTVSLDVHTDRLPSLILAIRSVSRNPRLCILLGGRVLMNDPQLALRVGADGTAADAQSAVALADRLVTANACREVFTA